MTGANLSIDDSFTLKFVNNTSSEYTFYLFNLGGSSANQTSFITQNIRSTYELPCSDFGPNGVFSDATTFNVKDALGNVIATANMLVGQTIANLLAAINPITDLQGNTGLMFMQYSPNGPTGKEWDFVFTLETVTSFEFTFGADIGNPSLSFVSYVVNNPFIFIQGVVPITTIQQSETGNAYRIMGIDILSDNPQQLTQNMNYGNRTADGNFWRSFYTPTIDPYQDNKISLHAVGATLIGSPMDNFTINTNTLFSYTLLATSYSRLTFNYVKASLSLMEDFNQALATELAMKFVEQKKYRDSLKNRKGVFLQ
jgi:hypothetical protein